MAKKKLKNLAIAFGGGGSHSAAHAGIMRALLEEYNLDNPIFSGTSGGAVTAVKACEGYAKKGSEGLIEHLDLLWEQLKHSGLYFSNRDANYLRATGFLNTIALSAELLEQQAQITEAMIPNYVGNFFADNLRSVFHLNGGFDKWFRGFYNPLLINHLKHFVDGNIDFKTVASKKAPKVLINAYDVKTHQGHIFSNKEINKSTLSASGTLPFLWRPVRYKKMHLIDGKYHANPPLTPLLAEAPTDIFIICLSTVEKDQYLRRELSNLVHELEGMKNKPNIHLIQLDIEGDILSKLNTDANHIDALKQAGYAGMKQWLHLNKEKLGKTSSYSPEKQQNHAKRALKRQFH